MSRQPFIGDRVIVHPVESDAIRVTGVVLSYSGPIIVIRRDDNPLSDGERYVIDTRAERLSVM